MGTGQPRLIDEAITWRTSHIVWIERMQRSESNYPASFDFAGRWNEGGAIPFLANFRVEIQVASGAFAHVRVRDVDANALPLLALSNRMEKYQKS